MGKMDQGRQARAELRELERRVERAMEEYNIVQGRAIRTGRLGLHMEAARAHNRWLDTKEDVKMFKADVWFSLGIEL